jgi:ketosteroid isomerase-like protein
MRRSIPWLLGLLVLVRAPAAFAHDPDEEARIASWLEGYVRAFNQKNLDELGTYYDERVTIYEGGGIDTGWPSYRDHHLDPELKDLEELQFAFADVAPHVPEKDARLAWVTASYTIKGRTRDRQIDGGGLQTLILVKGEDGKWRIRHSHTSSRRRPSP